MKEVLERKCNYNVLLDAIVNNIYKGTMTSTPFYSFLKFSTITKILIMIREYKSHQSWQKLGGEREKKSLGQIGAMMSTYRARC